MIVRPRPGLFQIFFILRGSMIPHIWPQIVAVAAISALIVYGHQARPDFLPFYNSSGPFTLLGIALSIFLGFRNNACYDRWWEARRQWGNLIYASRNLSRQTLMLEASEEGRAARRRIMTLAIAYAQALVPHLRPGDDTKATAHLDAALLIRYRQSRNRPNAILDAMSAEFAGARRNGLIGDIPYQVLDGTLKEMAHMQAACERILLTPVPFGYTLLLHRTAYIFCFLLPFGFADLL